MALAVAAVAWSPLRAAQNAVPSLADTTRFRIVAPITEMRLSYRSGSPIVSRYSVSNSSRNVDRLSMSRSLPRPILRLPTATDSTASPFWASSPADASQWSVTLGWGPMISITATSRANFWKLVWIAVIRSPPPKSSWALRQES